MTDYVIVRQGYPYQGPLFLQQPLEIVLKNYQIVVYDAYFQKVFIGKRVYQKYVKLLKQLVFFLETDDDSGVAYQEVLNQIERFRQLVKNQYRDYLLKNQLKEMARTLSSLQKQAQKKLLLLQQRLDYQKQNTTTRGGK